MLPHARARLPVPSAQPAEPRGGVHPLAAFRLHLERLEASVLTGGIAALEIRRADNLISSTTLHLVWSTRMAFLLPVAIG